MLRVAAPAVPGGFFILAVSFFDVLAAHADTMPDALALITEQDGTRTYAELVDRSRALTVGLRTDLGIAPGKRICLWAANHPAWAESYVAASAGSFATVAANPDWTDDEMLADVRASLADVDIACVLVQEMIPARLELSCGVRRDPTFGPIVAVGLGGTLIEVVGGSACSGRPSTSATYAPPSPGCTVAGSSHAAAGSATTSWPRRLGS